MGVNHVLLPISQAAVRLLNEGPEMIRPFTDGLEHHSVRLLNDGPAISALLARGPDDPLGILFGGSKFAAGYIGREGDNAADMGYGRAEYYSNQFLIDLAKRLVDWPVSRFDAECDVNWLEQNNVYPGEWQNPEHRRRLITAFENFRGCIMDAAMAGQWLVMWCE
jgi:hypothetical protein